MSFEKVGKKKWIVIAVVVVLGVVIAITAWREVVNQKREEEEI